MANLPQVPRENALTPQVQSTVSGATIAAPYMDIARGIGDIGVKLEDYQRMVDAGTVAKENEAAKTAALTFEQAANGDVEAFKTSWKTYTDDRLGKVPQNQRNLVEQNFLQIGGVGQRSIMQSKFADDRQTATDSWTARTASLTSDLSDLAASGDTTGDLYKQKHEELVGLYNERTQNPAWNYSQDHANLDITNTEDKLTGAAVTGELQRIYTSQGITAAEKRAQEIYADKTSGLSDVKKLKAISAALSSVRALYATDTNARAQFSVNVGEIVKGLTDGSLNANDPLIADMINQGTALKDPAAVHSLQHAQAVATAVVPMGALPLHDRLNYIDTLGKPAASGVSSSAAAILRQEEGFAPNSGWDVDAYRAGYGSDTVTLADGTVKKVTPGTVVTQADAERDLQRRLPDFIRVATDNVGAEAWAKLAPNVQGALVSVTYNYGHLPGSVVAAAQTGDPAKIADAVEALGKNAGINNPERRSREAAIIRGGAAPTGGPVNVAQMGIDVIPEVRASIKSSLLSTLPDMETIVKQHPLDQGQMVDLVNAARMVNDADVTDRVLQVLKQSDASATMLGTPVGDHQTYIDDLSTPGPVGDEAIRIRVHDAAVTTDKRMQDLLDPRSSTYDPRALGMEIGVFKAGPKVDWTDLKAAGAELTRRVPEMGSLEHAEQRAPNSLTVLRPEETAALAAAYQSATVQGKQALLATLTASLPPERLMTVLSGLASKPDTHSLAIAGALSSINPPAGAAVIRGEDALKKNPKFGFVTPNADEGKQINDAFPPSVFPPQMVGAWQDHFDAAKAAYADLSVTVGDASGNFNPDRWKNAVALVTGGILNGRQGEKIIAPIVGMTQQQFDALYTKVTTPYTVGANPYAHTFDGAKWPDGTPVTAADVQKRGLLQSSSDGKYFVELGKDTGIFAQDASGKRFELDLKNAAIDQAPKRVQDYVSPPAPKPVTEPPNLTNQQLHDVTDPALEAAKRGAGIDEQLKALDAAAAKAGLSPEDAAQLHRWYDHSLNPDATPSTGNQLQQGANPLPRGSVQVADASGAVPQSIVDQFNQSAPPDGQYADHWKPTKFNSPDAPGFDPKKPTAYRDQFGEWSVTDSNDAKQKWSPAELEKLFKPPTRTNKDARQFGIPGVEPSDSPLGAIANMSGAVASAAQNVWNGFTGSRVVQQFMAGWDNPQGINRAGKGDRLPVGPLPTNPQAVSTAVEQFADKRTFGAAYERYFNAPPTEGLTQEMIVAAAKRAQAKDAAAKNGKAVSGGVEGLNAFLNLMLVINQGIAASDAKKAGRAP